MARVSGHPGRRGGAQARKSPSLTAPRASFTSLSAQESSSLTKLRVTVPPVRCCQRKRLQTQAQARGPRCGRPHARCLHRRLRRSWAVCRAEAPSTEIVNSAFFWSARSGAVSVTGTPRGPKCLSPAILYRRDL